MSKKMMTGTRRNKLTASICLGTALTLAANAGLAQQNFDPVAMESMAEMESQHARKEYMGFFGGAVLGALLGGPPGAVIAASIGLIGSSLDNTEEKREVLADNLSQTRTELFALRAQQRELEGKYEVALREIESRNFVQTSLDINPALTACCVNSELSLHFKTNSAEIEHHYEAELARLAALVEDIPQPVVEVRGYADARGSSEENLALSRQRVRAVTNMLTSLGVDARVIQTTALGDASLVSQAATIEDHFFDRRVNVKVRSRSNELITLTD